MRKSTVPSIILAMALLGAGAVPGSMMKSKQAQAKSSETAAELWKKVQAAEKDGLPQTAVGHLKKIVELAEAGKRHGEALRALTRRLILEGVVEGNKPEALVIRVKEEIGRAPAAMKPVLRLVLARWYWHYFSRNKWRFLNRSAAESGTSEDFTTWDLRRLFREIDRLYRDILKDDAVLKKTPISDYSDFLEPGGMNAALRPTLFDFAAFEALAFYTSGEQAAALPEDAFVIEADSPALAAEAEFLRFAPRTTDADSPKLRALKIYQDLLRFHGFDSNKDIAFDADLQRLRYVRSEAAGEGASDRYLQRLRELAESHATSALAGLVFYSWAQEVYDRGDSAAAYALAQRGSTSRPESPGTANCQTLLARISAREFEVRSESIVPPHKTAVLAVRYRNVTALHFRAVRENFESLLKGREAETLFWMRDESVRGLLGREPAAQWTAALPPTADYKERETLVDLPALPPGFYRLLVSFNKNFSATKNKVQTASIWVGDLGIISGGLNGLVDGIVVRASSGKPVAKARLTLHQWNYNDSRLREAGTAVADEGGAFTLPVPESYGNRILVVRDGAGDLIAETRVESSPPRRIDPYQQTVFFTDRAIYRPGQTIYFKGLCLSVDRRNNDYKLLPRQAVRIVFRDANRQEISAIDLVSNDFGSLSGSLTAPADRLTGAMSIQTESPRGSCAVRVEEYKRPKFEVQLDVPDREFRLNDNIAVPGQALAYTGAPVDGAPVRYRILREVQYPRWWYWFGHPGGGSQEIAHGFVKTDAAGKFAVSFQARPDPSIAPSSQPVFTYSISVDVTDGAGETRSAAGSVRVAYSSLEAAIDGREWQEPGRPVDLSITTTTLNAKKVAAQGTVEIFALQGPDKPVPVDLIGEAAIRGRQADGKPGAGFSNTPDWRKWPEGGLIARTDFATKSGQDLTLSFDLKKGAYVARLKTSDHYGTAIESRFPFLVLDPADAVFPVRIPFHAASRFVSMEVGKTFEMLWGTGYGEGPVLIETLQNGRRIGRSWTPTGLTQGLIRIPVDESLRGGFTVAVSMVKENRFYREEQRVSVPWTNKFLALKWKTFRSKLRPGQAETWALQIRGADAEVRAAEFVASLYDASLDQFVGHGFPGISGIFRWDDTYFRPAYGNRRQDFAGFLDNLNPSRSTVAPTYAHFPEAVTEDAFGYRFPGEMRKSMARPMMAMSEAVPAPPSAGAGEGKDQAMAGGVVGGVVGGVAAQGEAKKAAPPDVDLSQVKARTNLNETAFFYPHLITDRDGVISLEFKMPEALTRWRLLGFAHTRNLESGSIEAETVTQKELMVQPNAPRFLREGDRLEFTVKVTNMAEKEAVGAVELRFFDPAGDKPLDAALANAAPKFAFSIPAKQSRSFSWPLVVPDGLGVVGYRAVAATAEFSDGEEAMVPVLSRRLLVRESIPLWINDKGEKSFTFRKLARSGESETLRNLSLTVQMASQPAWYAIQALPYLMEFPYECSEQVFNRLYANGLARMIAGSSPKIRRVFEQWKGTEALQSNLEKNQDLKSVLLQESPWVLEARSESQAKRNVGLLFDENTVGRSLQAAYGKLAAMQLGDGSWPWFPGGRGNSYITLYLAAGFGRLKHLGVKSVSQDLGLRALGYLDGWIDEIYREIVKSKTAKTNNLSPTIVFYLYGRSFYLAEKPIPDGSRTAVDYFLKQGAQFWLQLDNRQSQAHLALALDRFGDKETARTIMRSMKERSQVDEELGRYWAELEASWWWYRAPIETQAVMIEAFDEVLGDQKAVEECKIWLLKQKQSQDWKTTKATADAVYGLILRGTDLLASDAIVQVRLGTRLVEPDKIEAGTGFFEKRFAPSEIVPAMGDVKLTKTDKGIAWGGLHWQYMEDIAKITPHPQNPLTLKKGVFVQKQTKSGPVIEPVAGPVSVGDTLIIRIELRADRDMEYVHMKDHRGSGLEPVNVLSRYKYQDGLAYYEATQDTATHFFIDYLPKGTYVFEYALRVAHRGAYQNGMAHIECMYAPEFNSHSDSVKLDVR
jgi:hypothetical protein